MVCEIGEKYSRDEIRLHFPGLGPRDAVARNANDVAVVLLRNNEPGWLNLFESGPPRTLVMQVNRNDSTHNAALQNSTLSKWLYWSEAGGHYTCLGPIKYVGQRRNRGVGLFYEFEILAPNAPIPSR